MRLSLNQKYIIGLKELKMTQSDLGKEFKKNDLTTIHFKQFGVSRNKFKNSFDDDMQSVAEIAQSQGYQLLSKPINNNSGRAYWLTTAKSEDLDNGVSELENLI